MKLICNRDGCTEPATHQGYIGNPPVIVALCKVHAIENAIKKLDDYIKSLEPAHGLYLVSAPMVRNALKDILAIVDGEK